MPANDKRRASRACHDSVMEVFDNSGKNVSWSGRLMDCSISGARFCSKQLLAIGDKIKARLRLLDKGVLQISAHVVWSRKEENTSVYGIQFDSVKRVHPTGEIKGSDQV